MGRRGAGSNGLQDREEELIKRERIPDREMEKNKY